MTTDDFPTALQTLLRAAGQPFEPDEEKRQFRLYATGKRAKRRIAAGERSDQLSADVKAGQKAFDAIVKHNILLVYSIARRFAGTMPLDDDLADLTQIGVTEGLIEKAIPKFDVERGYKFSTFATWWIRQCMARAISQQFRSIRVPVHISDKAVSIRKWISEQVKRTGEFPDLEEYDAIRGWDVGKSADILLLCRDVFSLDHSTNSDKDESWTAYDWYGREDDIDIERGQIVELVRRYLANSSDVRGSKILQLYYGIPMTDRVILETKHKLRAGGTFTLEEISQPFGVTRERIRQILKEEGAKMRANPRFREEALKLLDVS